MSSSSPGRQPPAGPPQGYSLGVKVRLLASYRQYLPPDHDNRAGYDLEVAHGTAAGKLLQELPIPAGERYTFLINGRHADRDQVLREGDVLSVFPAAGGG